MPSENQNQQVLISIDEEIDKFQKFLEIEGNDRIFFSGKFGIGKTFFLREFAKAKENEYFTVHLYPVNYQTRNDFYDIVDLLKFDILTEILQAKDIDEFIDDKDKSLISFLFQNITFKDLLKGMSSITGELLSKSGFSVLGNAIGKSFIKLLELDEEYQKEKNEDAVIANFLEEVKNSKVVEEDIISQIIRNILNRIETQEVENKDKEKKNKKTILILDDLDRLDPDNIFRILNVFSAFFDKENENKFGFSKIIIVGDYENIKKIFHHKYGQDTDFQGYMDKFFSIKPYEYLNTKAILSKLDYFTSQTLNLKKEPGSFDEQLDFLIKYVFLEFLNNNLINLRELLKVPRYEIYKTVELRENLSHIQQLQNLYPKFNDLKVAFLNIDRSINLLISIFGGKESFLKKISELEKTKIKKSFSENFVEKLKYFNNIDKSVFANKLKVFVFLLSNIIEGQFFKEKQFGFLVYKNVEQNFQENKIHVVVTITHNNWTFERETTLSSLLHIDIYRIASYVRIVSKSGENFDEDIEYVLMFLLTKYIEKFF